MYLLFRTYYRKMKQYNIYSGLGGSFGGANYQYTTLCETLEEAQGVAFEGACEDYEQYAGLHGLPGWEDATCEYCRDNNLSEDELTDEDSQEIEEYYNEARESWLEYYAVATDEDDIDQNDLIIGYIVEDDSPSQADSK